MANTRFEFAPEAPFPRQPRMNQLLQSLYCSFPSGRCATWARESNSMPRAANTGVGPTHLPGRRGKPKRSQTNSAVLRFCAHWEESEGPAVTKSSKYITNRGPYSCWRVSIPPTRQHKWKYKGPNEDRMEGLNQRKTCRAMLYPRESSRPNLAISAPLTNCDTVRIPWSTVM